MIERSNFHFWMISWSAENTIFCEIIQFGKKLWTNMPFHYIVPSPSTALIKGNWCWFENCSGKNRRSHRKKSTACFCNRLAQTNWIIWCLKPQILWASYLCLLRNICTFQSSVYPFIGCQKIGLVEKRFTSVPSAS